MQRNAASREAADGPGAVGLPADGFGRGLFVTGTDTGVGKTVVAAAIVDHFRRRGLRVGALKPVATGCATDAGGKLMSEDADRLRAALGDRFSSDEICPVMYAETLTPSVAARRARQPVDWARIRAAIDRIVADSDVIVVEGLGGLHAPIDDRTRVIDLMRSLALPAVCVSRTRIGTINHTLLTVDALRAARVEVAGVVLNRLPMRDPGVADETNRDEIERLGGGPVRCVVPEAYFEGYTIPQAIAEVIDDVDWSRLARL